MLLLLYIVIISMCLNYKTVTLCSYAYLFASMFLYVCISNHIAFPLFLFNAKSVQIEIYMRSTTGGAS